MKALKIFLLGISVMFLTGCGIKPLEFKKINNVEVSTNNGLKVAVELTLYNPNRVKIDLDEVDVEVRLGSVYIGKLEAPELTSIEKKSEFKTSFNVQVKKQSMLVLGSQMLKLLSKKQIDINLKGQVHLKHKLVDRVIKIDYTEEVKL